MRIIGKILAGLTGLVIAAVIGIAAWLWFAPPELLRIADGYAAKIVCSNVFIAHRDPQQVLAEDVQAPGNPVLKFVKIKLGISYIKANIFGFAAPKNTEYHAVSGCTLLSDHTVLSAVTESDKGFVAPSRPETDKAWPIGAKVEAADPAIAKILSDPALTGPGMRAVVVVRDGKIIGESYGNGFTADTPLLGWSMTKTVNAAILGTLVKSGNMKLTDDHLRPEWTDDRATITIADLLAMKSGLAFNEDYGTVSDVSRMLFLQPDMAAYVANKPLKFKPGTHFSYSTGTATLLSRIWQDRLCDKALAYPRTALFNPLGMSSAVLETDEAGTFVGGSYLYVSGRDWARFGLFLEQDGVWNGKRLLPEDFMTLMRTSNGSKDGYSQAQTWLAGPQEDTIGEKHLPADTFWALGHDGQSIAVIPSQHLVVVRLGLTPKKKGGWGPEPMIKAIIAAH